MNDTAFVLLEKPTWLGVMINLRRLSVLLKGSDIAPYKEMVDQVIKALENLQDTDKLQALESERDELAETAASLQSALNKALSWLDSERAFHTGLVEQLHRERDYARQNADELAETAARLRAALDSGSYVAAESSRLRRSLQHQNHL